ncbi:hypothetical protein NPIL_685021 [Nephila pilipes]|uniref:Uncharacterized protein n=1 Tax=Nephila pilipes TaxID=299642 RepID=A0A8X6U0L5_NEPPI|nr:hypothetical protein NPIL_685021 [Nephila pilipes]
MSLERACCGLPVSKQNLPRTVCFESLPASFSDRIVDRQQRAQTEKHVERINSCGFEAPAFHEADNYSTRSTKHLHAHCVYENANQQLK